MSDLRLTVIVATYNHKNYIARCLDSLLSQKTNFNYIIKVVDDCSTDGTSDIVREYEKKYPDLIKAIIRDKNLGPVDSLYPVYCDIDTDYFYSIDGDDYLIDDNKFQIQVDVLDNHKDCTICAHNTRIIDVNSNNEELYICNKKLKSKIFTFYKCPHTHFSSRMYRNVVDYSKENKKIVWDVFCYYKFLSLGKLYYINKVMSVYYKDGNGIYSKLTNDEAYTHGMQTAYELDLFLKFKYTKKFRKDYLPEFCKHKNLKKLECKLPFWYRFIQECLLKLI